VPIVATPTAITATPADVRRALEASFSTRATHPLPKALQPPPEKGGTEFMGMAGTAGLSTTAYFEAFGILEHFGATHRLGAVSGE
jgi:hypothetical protein